MPSGAAKLRHNPIETRLSLESCGNRKWTETKEAQAAMHNGMYFCSAASFPAS
jgi:hypothetical protein